MAINQWDPMNPPIRPGLYTNFVNAAEGQITGGARGIVAIPLNTYTGGTATAKTFYTVSDETGAAELFGAANIQSIKFALAGGAREVLVYTMPATPATADYTDMRNAFEARPFNVFVFDGEPSPTERTNTLAWVVTNRTERKHFMFVTGGTAADDANPATGNTRSAALLDDYVVNLITGVTIDGTVYSSGKYAAHIAGLIAGTAINRSITFTEVMVDDVTKRLRNSEIVTALQAGSLVLVNDGEKVKIEQGITTAGTKIRSVRSRQAVATDVEKAARDNYIGKLDNSADGQAALISAIKVYLESLESNNVLTDIAVGIDTQNPSVGDTVFLTIAYREIDSMERIFLTINV
ncbi:phage tail sheath subtilisin-like domain-containing protein [Peribacillus butanolivorans]|uniref:phage tail sheath subtilisin-like domain-containing protein n=1 Tax=Peribacillus butanolivorans TaxID=421767 RepID=UPI00207C3FF0|nr:phage tail sheath subtilisin-like domain-containing protein [Peribacillus butanolivorans]MCO0597373.1 phage tail sheath subtilisin-like domain-containing protein [Peribacillus butanolivorans]